MIDIDKTPMVRVTWVDARDTETGWLDIKDVINAHLAICQEVGWMVTNNEERLVIMRSYSKDKEDDIFFGALLPEVVVKDPKDTKDTLKALKTL